MGRVIRVKEILNFLERGFADLSRQYDWDNSGKQLILTDQKISKTALALDPTEKVIEEAIKEGCELLITHHPLFFGKIRSLDISKTFDRKVIKAIQGGLSIVSAHTSLDLADFSLNDYICKILNANVVSSFIKEGADEYVKFVVFVPVAHADKVREAIIKSGGGHIGNYSGCTFSISGEGTFIPEDGTNPFIGKKGELEKVQELRIETIIEKKNLSGLLKAVVEAHPYEEVAHDVYKLDMGKAYGLGRVGELKEELSAEEFLGLVKSKLCADTLRLNMNPEGRKIKKFAVVTGSGASLWKNCLSAGVDVLITGDMKHHDSLDAKENGVMIIDGGHYETEKIYMSFLAELLSKEFEIETVLIEEESSIINWR
ncbi:MAG: Nif3-like dinuclear metal center hexameric protein [Denitrovibrio sp.]|nr:MAG: Nif3-like dinuclear metal center hexameric protein [Denitrovibrio sp.]